jgi:hypothetical protein
MAGLTPKIAFAVCLPLLFLLSAIAPTAAQSATDIDVLISRVGERVAEFYKRAQTVMCTERSTVQPVGRDWSFDGMPRTVESDLRIEMHGGDIDMPAEPSVIREVRSVNGRPPNPRDATSRSGCTDPNPLSPEPLAFLLPSHREEYRFTSVREAKDRDRQVLVIAFQTTNRKSRVELIQDEHGHDDCFDWKGAVSRKGRVWVDPRTDDVVKVESWLEGPIDIQVPPKLQRHYSFASWIVLERDDLTLRYKAVPFSDPDETLLLPESVESLTVLRSDLQSIRRRDVFTDYRRFLTSSRIKMKGDR